MRCQALESPSDPSKMACRTPRSCFVGADHKNNGHVEEIDCRHKVQSAARSFQDKQSVGGSTVVNALNTEEENTGSPVSFVVACV